jgi:UDP-glucose 4-epimerase
MPEQDRPARPPRALVTGAAGFIGAALCHELLGAGWSVLGLDDFSSGWRARLPESADFELLEGDVSEPGLLTRVLSEGDVEFVVHLAARVGVRSVLRDPEGCRASNLRGVEELISAIAALPAQRRPRLLAASSSEVYRESDRLLAEDALTRPTDGAGRWAYAGSKLRGEELLDAAQLWPEEAGAVHLRFFNVVGPGQDSDSGMVLPTFVECALEGRDLPVHGDGAQVRTFAHVDEVARVLRQLVELRRLPGGPLNIGGSARTSIAELAQLVRTEARSAGVVRSTDPRDRCGANFEEVLHREPSLARLESLGVELPSLSLEEIVRDSLARHAQLRFFGRQTQLTSSSTCASPAS